MNGTLIAVIVVVVIGIVGWLAYSQGYFEGTQEEEGNGIEIQFESEGAY